MADEWKKNLRHVSSPGHEEGHSPRRSVRSRSSEPNEEEQKWEAEKLIEETRRKREEEDLRCLAETEELNRLEMQKCEADLRELRERQERRKQERAEEEKRLAEKKKAEERKRREEEEERRRIKREEMERRRQAEEKRKMEAEEMVNKPNFIVNRRSTSENHDESDDMGNVVRAKEDMSKSKEQLEEEKRAILKQRIEPLSIESLNIEQLIAKAKEIHQKIYNLESEKYDLEERFKRQQYDMMELAERARQMNKGKKKGAVQTEHDKLADKYSGIPPKVPLASKYEKNLDRRSFADKLKMFSK
ncbi:troponin T isoform X8 [Lingula anatina]|uniref:Troponin T isoform X8 n=1 Tax=Lingula anatina TaxID=7574 RepID=A0A1S3JEA7_LINAN|nr:troponin T isoform X8 [Lingula anatina]|eukprot:XP_013408750.1 troponin T isoform X8 [Lingula anatina]